MLIHSDLARYRLPPAVRDPQDPMQHGVIERLVETYFQGGVTVCNRFTKFPLTRIRLFIVGSGDLELLGEGNLQRLATGVTPGTVYLERVGASLQERRTHFLAWLESAFDTAGIK